MVLIMEGLESTEEPHRALQRIWSIDPIELIENLPERGLHLAKIGSVHLSVNLATLPLDR